MPGSLSGAIFTLVLAVVIWVIAANLKASQPHQVIVVVRGIAGALGALTVILIISSCVVSIGTQDVGVKTSFGHPVDNGLSNGLHFKAPWEVVHRLDDAIQTDAYASNGYSGSIQQGAQDGCVSVRIARQATACVNVIIRWQIPDSGVGYLYRNYKSNDNIRDNLLHRDLQAAVNVAFATYDPLGLNAAGDSTQASTTELSAKILQELRTQVGQSLSILSVTVPIFNFDPDTQNRLNQLQLQVAQTRIATQAEQTAIAQAKANRKLAASVSKSPGVLESKCLDILQEAVQKGQALPAGFSCFPGGGSTSVAVK